MSEPVQCLFGWQRNDCVPRFMPTSCCLVLLRDTHASWYSRILTVLHPVALCEIELREIYFEFYICGRYEELVVSFLNEKKTCFFFYSFIIFFNFEREIFKIRSPGQSDSILDLHICFLFVNGYKMRFVFFGVVSSKRLCLICTQFAFIQESTGMLFAFDYMFSQIFLKHIQRNIYIKSLGFLF